MAKRILVADDEPMIIRAYLGVLGAEGYEVRAAKDGEEALARLEEEPADLVLLDIGMPGLTGWDVLATMRGRAEWRDIPVIIVTGSPEFEPIIPYADSTYQYLLRKKETGKELLQLVARVLGES